MSSLDPSTSTQPRPGSTVNAEVATIAGTVAATSIAVIVASSFIFFIIGFVCGHQHHPSDKPNREARSPIYEDTIPRPMQQLNQDIVKLDKNVAYCTVNTSIH